MSGDARRVASAQRDGLRLWELSARAGAIWPYGPADVQVPIAERFFAGGRSTNRAFDTDLLGIGRPDHEPLASETIGPIVDLIAKIVGQPGHESGQKLPHR